MNYAIIGNYVLMIFFRPLVQEKLAVLTNTGLGQDECLQAEVSTFRVCRASKLLL